MKKTQAAVYGLAVLALGMLQCANDYNPFENYSNAQVLVLPQACSKKIRDGDTLNIFSTETLAVYTTVREKIDSFRIDAPGNRYWPDTILRPPFTKENMVLLLSFWDTGRVQINVTTYRTNHTVSSLAAPLSFHVRDSLKQKDISTVLGSPCTLSTAPVGDNDDVLYAWVFGKDTVWGFASNTFVNPYPKLSHVEVGKTDTGYLWVTDFHEEFRSPATKFTYLFYQPSPPKIKCTNYKLLHGDTVITSDDTLVFTFQVIDSSGQGLASVDLSGEMPQTADSVTFYQTIIGMNQYSNLNPKVETIKATNKIGQTTIATFYLCYEASGPHGDLVKFRLVNPPGPTLTTRLDTLLYVLYIDNYSQDTVNVSTLATGKNFITVPFSDSVHKFQWLVPLDTGYNTIKTQASIPQRGYSAETTLVIQRRPLALDTTPPEITSITINGKEYPLSQPATTAFLVDSPNVIIAVSAIDNESGIASVTINEVLSGAGTPSLITMTYQNYEWVSSSIPFGSKIILNLRITVKNKTLGATNTTTRDIRLSRRNGVITPLQ
jgi:hypothetical protein